MKQISIVILALTVAAIFSSGSAYAWGPVTHEEISNLALADPRLATSSIAQTIKANHQCFDAGMTQTDITVIYYYTSGAKYEATHSWRYMVTSLAQSSDPCEQAYAFGIAAHELQDSLSHNQFVPTKLTEPIAYIGPIPIPFWLPNAIKHPIEEAKVEAHVIRDDPAAFQQLRNSLNILDNRPDLTAKMQDNIYASTGVIMNVKDLTGILREAIAAPDGFYTKYFALPGIYVTVSEGNIYIGIFMLFLGGVLLVLNYLSLKKSGAVHMVFTLSWLPILVILWLGYFFTFGGLAGITNVSDSQYWIDQSVDRTVEIFQPNGWNTRFSYDPTGFEKLAQADAMVYLYDTIVIVAVAGLYLAYIFYFRKKLKRGRK